MTFAAHRDDHEAYDFRICVDRDGRMREIKDFTLHTHNGEWVLVLRSDTDG